MHSYNIVSFPNRSNSTFIISFINTFPFKVILLKVTRFTTLTEAEAFCLVDADGEEAHEHHQRNPRVDVGVFVLAGSLDTRVVGGPGNYGDLLVNIRVIVWIQRIKSKI